MTSLVCGLLGILSDQLADGEMPDAIEFRGRLKSYCDGFASTGTIDDATAKVCLDDCDTQFRRYRRYLGERDAEVVDVIAMLRETLQQMVGDTKTFDERIFESSDRFKKMAALEDVREFRKRVTDEVRQLRQTMIEKQQYDEQMSSKLSKRIETLHSKLKVAREQALIDPLTQIANRAGLDRAVAVWTRSQKRFIVAMMDVDRFKSINDTYGHLVGDAVIVCVAKAISENLRRSDLVARFGGDEFAVLLSDIGLRQAEAKFNGLLRSLADRSYAYDEGDEKRIVKFTMSCGLSEFVVGENPAELFQRADEALFKAKKQRNCVSVKQKSLLSGLFPSAMRGE